ncbi:MAG: SurA N-terminal domain-containing protein [Pseudomonadota bacterium]|nr:SurA N-terminal domain-containing protein [Pseudomonadota bacterium]
MLSSIRAFAKSPFATALLGLLVISFGVWGIRDVFRSGGLSDAVVKAGSRAPITSAQFKDLFAQEKARREQQAGQTVSTEEAVKLGLDRGMVDQLASTEAAGAMMSAEGINPADELIAGELRKIPSFFNSVTGAFDKDTYQRALAERHMTPAQADSEFRDTIAERHYMAGIAAGLKAPRIYSLVQTAFLNEGRDFSWFAIEPKAVGEPAKPTDAQLQTFMKDNAAQFTRPELRGLSIVRFSATELAKTLKAPDADVQKRFNFEKETLSIPEKRTVIEISVKDAKAGAEAAAKLKAGIDPQIAAHDVGGQAATFKDTPKAAIADQKVAEAAFGLKEGEVAGPLQGDLGLAVIKVAAIAAAKPVTLADVRAKIESEVNQEQAKEKIYDLVQKYDDAHSGGSTMVDAAKAAGQQVTVIPPMTAGGATLAGQRVNLPPKVGKAAFTLPQGGESEVMDLGQGEYWVVHVDKVAPPAVFGLDEQVGTTKVRDAAERQYMLRELIKRLQDKATALTDEIKKGKSLEAAAAEVGAKVTRAENVKRTAAQPTQPGQPPAYSSDLLGRLFQAKSGEVVVGQDVKAALIVAKLEKIQEPSAAALAGGAEAARAEQTKSLYGDLSGAFRLAAQRKIKPTADYARARQALGLDPDAVAGKPKS